MHLFMYINIVVVDYFQYHSGLQAYIHVATESSQGGPGQQMRVCKDKPPSYTVADWPGYMHDRYFPTLCALC